MILGSIFSFGLGGISRSLRLLEESQCREYRCQLEMLLAGDIKIIGNLMPMTEEVHF